MKNKLLILFCCAVVASLIIGVMFFRQHSPLTQVVQSQALAENELQSSAQNVEDDLMLIEALSKDAHTSLAQKEEMTQALVKDLESLELQEDQVAHRNDKRKLKTKKRSSKEPIQSMGRVRKSLTPEQARRAIEIITAEIVDVNNAKSLDEHFAEMLQLSECLDLKVKADVAAKKAVEYIKKNKYLITKDLSTWEIVSKGPFVYAAYCALPKSKQFVELYERDAELFKKVLQEKDAIKS